MPTFGKPHTRPLMESEREGFAAWERTLEPRITRWRYLEEGRPDETFDEWRDRMIAAGVQPEEERPPLVQHADRSTANVHAGHIINVRGPHDPPPVVL